MADVFGLGFDDCCGPPVDERQATAAISAQLGSTSTFVSGLNGYDHAESLREVRQEGLGGGDGHGRTGGQHRH